MRDEYATEKKAAEVKHCHDAKNGLEPKVPAHTLENVCKSRAEDWWHTLKSTYNSCLTYIAL
jgi:hypothetical protein